MATKKKMLQAAAGNAGGAGLDIDEVFSTYLYTGTGSTLTINNGIDLAGEGGLTWIKNRGPNAANHAFYDTERGVRNYLMSNSTNAQDTASAGSGLTAFNSNGFTLGTSWLDENNNGQDVASWTFRKAPKFFTCVTYTGTGSAQTISHNLGSVPGCIIVKLYSGSGEPWEVYHRGVDSSAPEDYRLTLNTSFERSDSSTRWNDTAPTSTEFTVGTESSVNGNGSTYVAYLFAHNDGDGEFGPDGDQDIIKCGSLTVSSQATVDVNLGFEAQWVMLKHSSSTGNWFMFDVMRGMAVTGFEWLYANTSDAAEVKSYQAVFPTATGFGFNPANNGQLTDGDYIYMAIRRGPLAQPESGTEVFKPVQAVGSGAGNPAFVSTFTTDAAIFLYPNGGSSYPKISSRLTGATFLETHSSGVEATSDFTKWDFQTGAGNGGELSSDWSGLLWKRAPGFCDVVAYTGNRTGGASQVIPHNLTVLPEMIWVKNRTEGQPWQVYTATTGNTKAMYLDTTNGATTDNSWGNTSPTATNFTVGDDSGTNNTDNNFIAYLFATLPGVSKVGSYTGTGSAFNVDCGFTAGARFVLIKKTSGTGDWGVFDTARGITDSSSPLLRLNNTTAEANFDYLDPYSGGFAHSGANLTFNAVGAEYIFYAIA